MKKLFGLLLVLGISFSCTKTGEEIMKQPPLEIQKSTLIKLQRELLGELSPLKELPREEIKKLMQREDALDAIKKKTGINGAILNKTCFNFSQTYTELVKNGITKEDMAKWLKTDLEKKEGIKKARSASFLIDGTPCYDSWELAMVRASGELGLCLLGAASTGPFALEAGAVCVVFYGLAVLEIDRAYEDCLRNEYY